MNIVVYLIDGTVHAYCKTSGLTYYFDTNGKPIIGSPNKSIVRTVKAWLKSQKR